MYPKPNDLPTESDIPPIKVKRQISQRRMVASGLLIALITFLATSALLLLFALMFAPQLSNALWNTDLTQQALYGTSAAVGNAQTIVDMTSTALSLQSSDQQQLIETMTQRDLLLSAREADLNATEDTIQANIVATQTADVVINEQQRTQAAVNFSTTQLAINQQSTLVALEATSTQKALESRPDATPTADERPFVVGGDVIFRSHPDGACNWQGVAGQIIYLEGSQIDIDTLQIRLLYGDTDRTVQVGDNLGLDESYDWAVQISDAVNKETYFLRLESLAGDALSPMVQVTFTESCTANLAIINLSQVQALDN